MGGPSASVWNRRPPNLKRRKKKGVWYYSYKDPKAGTEIGLGPDFERARDAVQVANARLGMDEPDLVARIVVPKEAWGDHLDWFDREVLQKYRSAATGKPLDDETLYIRRLYIKKLKTHFGATRETATITRRDCAAFLELQTDKQFNRYRQFMDQVFRHTVARGLRDDNPMLLTIARQTRKARQRLTRAAFDDIRKQAPEWLQRAMDLALWSLQRREDMATWRDPENWHDGKLWVRQGKVESHGTGLLCVAPGKNLLAAIVACLNAPDRGGCPYLVHAVPRKKGRKAKWRVHPFQVDPDMITREFKRIADTHKVFEGMTEDEKPTWAEIRPLGGDLYRTELGWSDEQVQALMGHTELRTTRKHYLSGHGERWSDVTAG